MSEPFGTGKSAWKYGAIFGSLVFAAVLAGVVRIIWVKRRNRRLRAEERRATARIDSLSGMKGMEATESRLFGIRALEAGFTGGIAQPKSHAQSRTDYISTPSPKPSQTSFIMESPPRRPPRARSASPAASQNGISFQLRSMSPMSRSAVRTPETRPSVDSTRSVASQSMWFNQQSTANVPAHWYLPTSEEIFSQVPVRPSRHASPRGSPRPSVSLERRASVKTANSDETSDSATTRGRNKLQPSDAELSGRLNHSRDHSRLTQLNNFTSDEDTSRPSSGETTGRTGDETRTTPPTTPPRSPPLPSISKTEDERPSVPNSPPTGFEFSLENSLTPPVPAVTRPESMQLEIPDVQERPLSIQSERFSVIPSRQSSRHPDSRFESPESSQGSRMSRGRTSSIELKRNSSTIAYDKLLAHYRNESDSSYASTIRPTNSSTTAPTLSLHIEDFSNFEAFSFPSARSSIALEDKDALGSEQPIDTAPHPSSSRHRKSLSASTFATFNTHATRYSEDQPRGDTTSPKPSFEEFAYASAQEARSPKETPRLSFIRNSVSYRNSLNGTPPAPRETWIDETSLPGRLDEAAEASEVTDSSEVPAVARRISVSHEGRAVVRRISSRLADRPRMSRTGTFASVTEAKDGS